jgi:hypothetical protein
MALLSTDPSPFASSSSSSSSSSSPTSSRRGFEEASI